MLMLPLAIQMPGGWTCPALFAPGTTLRSALDARRGTGVTGRMARVEPSSRLAAGSLVVLAGLHDTVIYWWL
jgi:hypothetical protein